MVVYGIWIVSGTILFSLAIRGFYLIGKGVKKKEAEIKSQVKKNYVEAKRKQKNINYARKSTPKVPSNDNRQRKN